MIEGFNDTRVPYPQVQNNFKLHCSVFLLRQARGRVRLEADIEIGVKSAENELYARILLTSIHR